MLISSTDETVAEILTVTVDSEDKTKNEQLKEESQTSNLPFDVHKLNFKLVAPQSNFLLHYPFEDKSWESFQPLYSQVSLVKDKRYLQYSKIADRLPWFGLDLHLEIVIPCLLTLQQWSLSSIEGSDMQEIRAGLFLFTKLFYTHHIPSLDEKNQKDAIAFDLIVEILKRPESSSILQQEIILALPTLLCCPVIMQRAVPLWNQRSKFQQFLDGLLRNFQQGNLDLKNKRKFNQNRHVAASLRHVIECTEVYTKVQAICDALKQIVENKLPLFERFNSALMVRK